MKVLFSSIILLTLLSGCVSIKNVNLSVDDSKNMRGKRIAFVSRDKSDMLLKTPVHMALAGLLSYFDMVRQGNNIVKDNNIEDPSILSAKKLQTELASYYDLKIVSSSLPNVDTYSVSKISDLYHGVADYVVDVRTLKWELSYIAMDISNYTTVYSSHFRLIDVNNSRIVAENSCEFRPYNKYQKAVMLADGAKILKQQVAGAYEACSKRFKELAFDIR